MKRLSILGYRFSLKLEQEDRDDMEIYDINYKIRDRVIRLILLVSLIVFSGEVIKTLKETKYFQGNIVKENIYSPRSVRYNNKIKKEEIIKSIIENTKEEYIYSEEVETQNVRVAKKFYEEVLRLKVTQSKKSNFKEIENIIRRKIPSDIVESLVKLPLAKLKTQSEDVQKKLEEIYRIGIKQEDVVIENELKFIMSKLKVKEEEARILSFFIEPNYVLDEKQTEKILEDKISKIGDQIESIEAGSLILKRGDLLTREKIDLLNRVGIYSFSDRIERLGINFFYLLIISIIGFRTLTEKNDFTVKNQIHQAVWLITVITIVIFRLINLKYLYIIPFDIVFILLRILIKREYAFTISMILLAYILPLTNYNLIYFLVTAVALFYGRRLAETSNTRNHVINQGIKLAAIKFGLYLSVGYLLNMKGTELLVNSMGLAGSGILSGIITLAIVPYFERTFNILTTFKLLELGDLSHPLLKDLAVKTPGTFYHSSIVASLSAEAAEAIGADPVLAKVASYYHDIGKIKRPKFYVENQERGENPHDKISPYLSALVILTHTKDGVDLAKEHRIPKEIRDIMVEHHGTTLLTYFYNKAKTINPNVREEEFRYQGPKPRTKESAIIMLADSIEAAVRSIENKTYVSVESMIRKIITNKMHDEQLAESDLTYKEIETIMKVFTKTMMGIHHIRIKYPDQLKEVESKI